MSRQDADDESSDPPGEPDNGDESTKEPTDVTESGADTADDGPVDTAGDGDSTDGPDSDGSGGEPLEEIAEEPEEDADEVLSEILDDSESEITVNSEGDAVEEDLRKDVEKLSVDETARLVAALQSEVADLEAKLDEERERADDLESRLARKQADFQNYKERQERERERVREQATQDVVERFVEVRDNLVRALEQDEDTDIRGGVESTLSVFDDELDRAGVSVIDPAAGEDPDPRRHEVLATVAGEQPSGTISETHRPGYEMDDSVIRPAQVAVSDGSLREDETAKDTADAADSDDTSGDEDEA
jgi:molecular chaperone GrpE